MSRDSQAIATTSYFVPFELHGRWLLKSCGGSSILRVVPRGRTTVKDIGDGRGAVSGGTRSYLHKHICTSFHTVAIRIQTWH